MTDSLYLKNHALVLTNSEFCCKHIWGIFCQGYIFDLTPVLNKKQVQTIRRSEGKLEKRQTDKNKLIDNHTNKYTDRKIRKSAT